MFILKGKYTTATVMIDNVEPKCIIQIQNMIDHPAFTNPVIIMPDTHAGKGSVIGFTMKLNPNMVIPNVIGYDVGCGMLSVNIENTIFEIIKLDDIDRRVRANVPFGMNTNYRSKFDMKNNFPWNKLKGEAQKFCTTYQEDTGRDIKSPQYSMPWFEEMCDRVGVNIGYVTNSIGTLGGGNHFIEFGRCVENNSPWVTIHSGSRNLGKRVCEYWQGIANKKKEKDANVHVREEIKHMKNAVKDKTTWKEHIDSIKEKYHVGTDKGLSFLTGDDTYKYMFDMIFAQKYAEVNRLEILRSISSAFGGGINLLNGRCVESIHNYISPTDLIIRKGAIESYAGCYQIIPFNMRDGILLVEGKSNSEWNCSAPHGAGRVMSRGEAKRKLDFDKFKDQMKGIYSTSVTQSTLDEAPDAYKDSKIIEEAIEPTCKIINRIKPILNLKDLDEKISWADIRKNKKMNKKKKKERR